MKKSKIKIIKDKVNNDSYTFLSDLDLSSQNSGLRLNSMESKENTGINETDNPDKIYKKKKVLTSKDVAKSSKGLKFSNPSQRNHSSIYE
ncbi:MAG: hypothetical protein L0H55_16545 [Candidatus Nitrosocosmicus sp.]|nr:hypothetical protein [Candidatus Nitrosocosmicus sp.]